MLVIKQFLTDEADTDPAEDYRRERDTYYYLQ
jgi:hypothetical protein